MCSSDLSIQPIAFLVIINGEAKLLQVSMNASSQNAIINLIPDVVDKVSEMFGSSKKSDNHEKK